MSIFQQTCINKPIYSLKPIFWLEKKQLNLIWTKSVNDIFNVFSFAVLCLSENHHSGPEKCGLNCWNRSDVHCVLWPGTFNYITHNLYSLHSVDGWLRDTFTTSH